MTTNLGIKYIYQNLTIRKKRNNKLLEKKIITHTSVINFSNWVKAIHKLKGEIK